MKEKVFSEYLSSLNDFCRRTEVTDTNGRLTSLQEGIDCLLVYIRARRAGGCKLMWMGNGGSAAIASHEANDFMKNGNCRSMSFHDPALLTCFSNDYGYGAVFEEMMRRWANPGDIAVFISSSGKSENVVRGAMEARKRRADVVTLTGFAADNPLRQLGDLNFYVPSNEYGYVELAHQIICHAALDLLDPKG